MEETKRVLFVNSEIFPYMPETDISKVGRYLPQGVQESGKEIRSFMPRYGCINERRNQLHEVIRLSGMNIVVGKIDRPLVIKVSSISSARMQVYFIDNEDYFHRKSVYCDAEGKFFEDNDQRALFFARGVLETVKKLRWKPDIVHCQGWISHFLPTYLKTVYNADPIFSDAKVVISLYKDSSDITFREGMAESLKGENISADDAALLQQPTGINLAKLAIRYADGIIEGVPSSEMGEELASAVKNAGIPVLSFVADDPTSGAFVQEYNKFYDQILK